MTVTEAVCLLGFALMITAFLAGFLIGRASARRHGSPKAVPRPAAMASADGARPRPDPARPVSRVAVPTSPGSDAASTSSPRPAVDKSPLYRPPSMVKASPDRAPPSVLHKRLAALDLSTIDVQRTPEFDRALELVERGRPCVFVTGAAGTGKSVLLKYMVLHTARRAAIVAPTGVAALNVGGQTIHSFFRFRPGHLNELDRSLRKGHIYQALETLVVDEVSMVRADLLDAIDHVLRLGRGQPHVPFGGLQVVLFGDLFQLPPVVTQAEEGQFFSQYYASPYFFDASVFDDIDLEVVKLKTVYRQADPGLLEILGRVRVNRMLDSDLAKLNQRVDPGFDPASDEGFIELTTTNREAQEKNLEELEKLRLPQRYYEADIQGHFVEGQYPTDYTLPLRVGAQVMLLNNDVGRRWVNGTVGVIEELLEYSVVVRIPAPREQPDRVCEVERYSWDVCRYRIDHQTGALAGDVVGSFSQLPLKLAWAITIHKSQGKTLDRAVIDLSSGTFAHGQAYVALSRCASIEGMVLRSPLRKSDVIVDPRVFRFMKRIPGAESAGP